MELSRPASDSAAPRSLCTLLAVHESQERITPMIITFAATTTESSPTSSLTVRSQGKEWRDISNTSGCLSPLTTSRYHPTYVILRECTEFIHQKSMPTTTRAIRVALTPFPSAQ
jgi:hypothetical protein